MKFLQTTALVASTAFAAYPAFAEDVMLSGIEVEANLSAYEDSNALTYWPTLDKDLTKAILNHVKLDDQSEAPKLQVEINKVAVDGDTFLPDSGEFNQLEGTVVMFEGDTDGVASNENDGASSGAAQSYALKLSATAAEGDAPEGWIVVPPSQDDFYNALVNAYAMEVVERIKE